METRTGPTGSTPITAWVGWIVFAAVLLVMMGVFDIIAGLIAIFDDKWVTAEGGRIYVLDSTAWGWITLILGLIVLFAAFGMLKGKVWGRAVGVLVAGLTAIHQIFIISLHPIWSLVVIMLAVFVIYALTVHGGELRQDG